MTDTDEDMFEFASPQPMTQTVDPVLWYCEQAALSAVLKWIEDDPNAGSGSEASNRVYRAGRAFRDAINRESEF